MEAMTLDQVRDILRQAATDKYAIGSTMAGPLADAIDAHLAQPAQAVDAYDLAAEIRRVDSNHNLSSLALSEALIPFLTRALSSEKAGPVGDREYRLLGPGDVIEPDDEFIHDNAVDWVPLKTNPGAAQLFAGMQYRLGTLKQARRPLPASPTPDKEG